MSVVAVGLNHRSAPLPLLEKVAVQPEDLGKALTLLISRDNVSEVVVLSTCMRTEVYAVAERFHGAVADILDFLSTSAGVGASEIEEHSYSHYDASAVAHLFRVSAGLDSAVLGEGEVLGQVRDAWDRAMVEQAAGSVLNTLFRHATEVGKRSRAETAIARGITSVPQAGVALAASATGVELDEASVLIIGAGSISGTVAAAVAEGWSPRRLAVVSRAEESAEGLCSSLAASGYGQAVPARMDRLVPELSAADVVFTATASTDPVVTMGDVLAALSARVERPLVIVDLAVPRDVEPAVATIPGVTLHDMDSIRDFVEDEMTGKLGEVEKVAAILEEEVSRYLDTASARRAAPLVAALRSRADEIRKAELVRLARRSPDMDESQRAAVDALTKSIIAKLLHEPTVRLKSAAGTPRGERLSESLRDLFDL